jgi:hypothetical protein
LTPSKLSCLWNKPFCAKGYRAAVCLHGHTNRSKESLQFLPELAENWPLLKWALDRQCSKSKRPVDFRRAYWTPPLPPQQAFDLETKQIEERLGIESFVSLTDHDNIEAASALRLIPQTGPVLVSMEWSVPFRGAVLHLGIHNLPERIAPTIMADLADYTSNPNERRLTELLSSLDQDPGILIVFNHPLWEVRPSSGQQFVQSVDQFLELDGGFIHAIEINASRSWRENFGAFQLAERWQRPLVSGGDRHGSEPSAGLNLTQAETFEDFVTEIRRDGPSHIVLMPQYQQPYFLRTLRTLLDVIREYPEFPVGSRRWEDRVYHPDKSGELDRPLSTMWRRPPEFIERIFSVIRLAETDAVVNTLKLMLTEKLNPQRPADYPSEATL